MATRTTGRRHQGRQDGNPCPNAACITVVQIRRRRNGEVSSPWRQRRCVAIGEHLGSSPNMRCVEPGSLEEASRWSSQGRRGAMQHSPCQAQPASRTARASGVENGRCVPAPGCVLGSVRRGDGSGPTIVAASMASAAQYRRRVFVRLCPSQSDTSPSSFQSFGAYI